MTGIGTSRRGLTAASVAVLLTALGAAGCGDDEGGSTSSQSPSGTGGAGGTGVGATTSGAGPASSSSGGPGGTGGGGEGGASSGQGPTSTSSGGEGGAGGSGGGPTRSAGCGLPAPASGELTIDVGGQEGSYVLSLPASYDPDVPIPLGFGFHGAGRTGPQCQAGDCAGFQSVMESEAALVYMTSIAGPSWGDDFDLNDSFFVAVLDHLLATTCIDVDRVFVAGTSSGAHFTNLLGCRHGDRLAAIAPVAGYLPESEGCVGEVAALVIHGVDDGSFDAGVTARDFWRQHSGCDAETVPPISEIHDAVVEERESHGCAEYQGCDAGVPVVWCEHSEGGYDGSTHGWPLFGGQRIWEFVSAL
jgi:polyhydroxybutyrate depolymerase